jgi:hypothetical protein
MTIPCLSTVVIDGKSYRWRDLQRLRKEQLAPDGPNTQTANSP